MAYNSEYYEQWRKKNWDKRKEYMRERITCECGCVISRGSKYLHVKNSKKHLSKIK